MQSMPSLHKGFNGISRALINTCMALLAVLLLFAVMIQTADAAPKKKRPETPKGAITVKNFEWRSGGMGRSGILRQVTLENKGTKTYKNIEIVAEFFSESDVPLGSLRSTIHDTIEPGSEKTFNNLDFGLMHSDLGRTELRVVNAELVESGTPDQPKDLIIVKGWEWEGGQYATEGILRQVTLQNVSKNNYKDMKIRVNHLGVGGPKLGIKEGYISIAVIHDVLPANSTKTYHNINVGFKHPDAKSTYINVINATTIGNKELRYRLAQKGEAVEPEKDKATGKVVSKAEVQPEGPAEPAAPREETLAERYKRMIAKKAQEAGPTSANASEGPAKSSTLVEKEVPPPAADSGTEAQAPAEEAEEEEEFVEEGIANKVTGKISRLGKRVVGIFTGDKKERDDSGDDEGERVKKRRGSADYQGELVESDENDTTRYRTMEEEEEEAFPQQDIIVKSFEMGSGVTGTIGVLKEVVLVNRSNITYRNVEVNVDFYDSTYSKRPLGSNKVRIYGILPPKSEKVFRNVQIGYLNFIPQELELKVMGAQY